MNKTIEKKTTDEKFYMVKKLLINLIFDTDDMPKLNTMSLQLHSILERLDRKRAIEDLDRKISKIIT